MYTVYNNVEDTNIFYGGELAFINFTKRIAIENEDTNVSINNLSEAKSYIQTYCGNLDLQIN